LSNPDIIGEIIRNSIAMFFALVQLILATSFGVLIVLYIDSRSLKKGMGAAFRKIRALENWARSQGYIPPPDDEINKGIR
jgi:hypothetical protein